MYFASISVMAFFLAAQVWGARPEEPPRLVVQITIDQLRGDMPLRFSERFSDGGFRHFLEQGLHYTNAMYQHSTTFTAVGHATLFTGGTPIEHGIVGNDWADPVTGGRIYCVEDSTRKLLGMETKAHAGTSPRNLASTTTGDQLRLATANRARVFGVSIKDRGAILGAGHFGKAFWYDSSSGRFITSDYYYEDYPEWVAVWNDARPADRYRGTRWTLLHDPSTYVYKNQDDVGWEKGWKHLGRSFPHSLDAANNKDFYGGLRFAPMGDELTVDFAKELIRQEGLGQDETPDLLALSLSATDYIGHAWGPSSLEAEDNLLRLDGTLADLLTFIDGEVGLDRTLLVLSSDHGIDHVPGHMIHEGLACDAVAGPDLGATAERRLQVELGIDRPLISAFWNPCFYFDRETLAAENLDVAEMERRLAETLMTLPGVANAWTRTDLLAGNVPDHEIGNLVHRSFHPRLSGNVILVQKPSWFLYHEIEAYAAMHGSPYGYDRYVPIFFAGPGIEAASVAREVAPGGIAPTICSLLGLAPPTGSVGRMLTETLE